MSTTAITLERTRAQAHAGRHRTRRPRRQRPVLVMAVVGITIGTWTGTWARTTTHHAQLTGAQVVADWTDANQVRHRVIRSGATCWEVVRAGGILTQTTVPCPATTSSQYPRI